MPYNSLADFVQVLERAGELKRIDHPVKAELEISEIADRVMKSGGPALLFENVVGKQIPLLINAFGSTKRMALALGVPDIEDIARDIAKLIQTKPPKSFKDKFRLLGELIKLAGIPPKLVKEGPCQEVIKQDADLNIDRKSTRLNSSHSQISYAVHRDLHSFPTRRSSDLIGSGCARYRRHRSRHRQAHSNKTAEILQR